MIKRTKTEFGIWRLPATMGAYRLSVEHRFNAAMYDAVEREATRLKHREILASDVQTIIDALKSHEISECQSCGRLHSAPACES